MFHHPQNRASRLLQTGWNALLPIARRGFFVLWAVAAVLWLGGCATAPVYTNVTHFTTVVIDAGHGGHDSGAISRGRRTRLLEKNLALDVALRVDVKLRAAGLRTVMTRHDDTFIPLDERVRISNRERDSIFVSIHFNDSFRRKVHGAETYQNGRGTEELAQRIERAVSATPSSVNRGVMHANYRVLRNSHGPAVLVECGYLSNASETARCGTPAHREKIASAIARAILDQRRL